MNTVSLEDRLKAKSIIKHLLTTFTIDEVAVKLHIKKIYVYFAASLQRQIRKNTIRYLAPNKVIQAVLTWAN